MIKKVFGAVLMSASLAMVSHAQTKLTFEGIDELSSVGSYYNGVGGPAYGVTFTGAATVLGSEVAPCQGSFGFAGQPSGCNAFSTLDFSADPNTLASAYLNRSLGFVNAVSFYYTSVSFPVTVSVFSGVGGAGSLLGTAILPMTQTSNSPQCGGETFCPFSLASLSFSGIGQSVKFIGMNGNNAFDDVAFTAAESVPPTTTTPEPATYALMGFGLSAVAFTARRRRTN